ncbi:MAG: transcriptional regulator [Candidatus Hodarchaeota archaeon]
MKTRREKIIELLSKNEEMTLQELADLTHSALKTIIEDIDSVRKTIKSENKRIEVSPASCMSCNYIFSGRNRISDPSKCPECHSERISSQRFRIVTY